MPTSASIKVEWTGPQPRWARDLSPEGTCEHIIRRCVHLLGPEGTSTDLLLEKWCRDAKTMELCEGSGQIQRLVVARSLMGRATG